MPYGRGFMYLAQVDAKIRAKSKGTRSLDALVVDLYQRRKNSQSRGIKEWLELVTAQLGAEGKRDFEAMVEGETVVALANPFGLCLTPVKESVRPFALGFDEASINGAEKIIRGVVPRSAAEQAGLRNGDEVIDAGDVLDIQRGKDRHMTLTVRRDGNPVHIDYLPRGTPVVSYRWAPSTSGARDGCMP